MRKGRNNPPLQGAFCLLFLLLFSAPLAASENAIAGAGTWISIIPPVAAILLALLLKQVIPALLPASGWAPGPSTASAWSGFGMACWIRFKSTFLSPRPMKTTSR